MSNEKSTPNVKQSFRLEVSGGFLLMLSLTGFLCGPEAPAAAMLAAVFHELGHVALILAQGSIPRRLMLDVSGACLHCDGPPPSFRQELIRAFAGPGMGLLLFLLLHVSQEPFLRLTSSMSLMLSLVNLLPVAGLDGGRILACLLSELPDDARRARLLALFDGSSTVLALAMGILHSPQLFLYGLWLLFRRVGRRSGN